jgi:negative regulator of sigma E activity
MTLCEELETKLSAALDGELNSAEVPLMMEHLAKCSECQNTYLTMRSLNARIREFEEIDHEELPPSDKIWKNIAIKVGFRNKAFNGYLRFWPIVPAVAIIIILSFVFGAQNLLFPENTNPQENAITLEEHSDAMTEQRFVQLVQELIQSDRKYQFEMLRVMKEIVQIYPGNHNSEGEFRTKEQTADLPSTNENTSPEIGS